MSETMSQAICATLAEQMEQNDKVVILGDAVGVAGGCGGSTSGLLATFGASRVRDMPVSDRGTVGVAVGLALAGMVPVVEVESVGRLLDLAPALHEAGRLLKQTAISMVIRVPFGTQAGDVVDAPALGAILGVPGIRIGAIGSASSARAQLTEALSGGVTVLLEPRVLYNQADTNPPVTAATRVMHGTDVTLAAWGSGVVAACAAANTLTDAGVSADVIDMAMVVPLDDTLLVSRVKETGRLVVVSPDDGHVANTALLSALNGAFLYLESPFAVVSADVQEIHAAAMAAVTY